MKKILMAVALIVFSATAFSQDTKTTDSSTNTSQASNADTSRSAKYHDNIDDRMKGPNGEAVYIGTQGGRYYMKNGKKIYVAYKGNKKKS